MDQDTLVPLELPAVARKNVFFAFDGGRLSSNGGVLPLREDPIFKMTVGGAPKMGDPL